MKKPICIMNPFNAVVCALGLCTLTVCGQEVADRFQAGEWDVSPFATYVDKKGGDWGLGASVTYYLTRNIGVGASTYWTDFGGTFFDNLYGEAYFRLPIGRRVSPYAVGSAGYVFENNEWSATLGGGIDFRAFKKISAFSDIQWRFVEHSREGAFLRLGVRIAF